MTMGRERIEGNTVRSVADCVQLPEIIDIRSMIRIIRGQQVMLDRDLALLYGVETKRLNEQVKRNIERFPADFMFQLSKDDVEILKSLCFHGAGYSYAQLSLKIADCGRSEHPHYAGLCLYAPIYKHQCTIVPTA